MKKYALAILVLIVATLTACAVKASQNVPSAVAQSSTIISEEKSETETLTDGTIDETTSQNTSKKQSTTTAKPAETSKQSTTKSQATTKPVATTKKQPTTQKPTEKQTTTQKQTTTKKQPTTKAPTTKPQTTKPKPCTNNYNHYVSCGNMGRWFSSKSDVRAFVDAEMNKWNNLFESGAIGEDEYFRNCPSGYECWSCSNCGKWTGNFTY